MREYEIITLSRRPEFQTRIADWFSQKWGIPRKFYVTSTQDCAKGRGPVPQWYVALCQDRIVGGLGVIENDFHDRKDLTPNVCAVYVEEEYRCQGIAGELLNFVCKDMAARGVRTLYLVTDHTSFYERYGWEHLCMVQGDDEPDMARLYVHQEL